MNDIIRTTIMKAGGPTKVGRAVGLTDVAVHKWMRKGMLPRTEHTGETRYAAVIAKLANDPTISAAQLRAAGRNQASEVTA